MGRWALQATNRGRRNSKGRRRSIGALDLLAFGCYKKFEEGKNYYLGYLSFESKTQLIELYQNKYGATFVMGQKIFFEPSAGKELMKKYLTIKLTEDEEE